MALDIEGLAPTLFSLGVTETQADNKFSQIPDPPQPDPEPEITLQKANQLFNAVFTVRDGLSKTRYTVLANTIGLSRSQVEKLIKEMRALYGAWLAEQAGE